SFFPRVRYPALGRGPDRLLSVGFWVRAAIRHERQWAATKARSFQAPRAVLMAIRSRTVKETAPRGGRKSNDFRRVRPGGLKHIRLQWRHNAALAEACSRPPCGEGWGVPRCGTRVPHRTTPLPSPPPQGGREHTERVAPLITPQQSKLGS